MLGPAREVDNLPLGAAEVDLAQKIQRRRVAAAARALARAFTRDMLARVDIQLPEWALLVSDLVAIEQKQAFANQFVPGLVANLHKPDVQTWIDEALKSYGKDGRGLVREALQAWAQNQGEVGALAVAALG